MTIGWSFIENFESESQLYKNSRNASEQKRCTTNEKYDSNTNSCVPCESGTYQSADNHTSMNCKIKDDLILNGYNNAREGQNVALSKIENKKTLDECRQHVLDEKRKGNTEYDNVVMIGHRNSNHHNHPTYKNTCWFVRNNAGNSDNTVNAMYASTVTDNIHTMACVDSDGNPTECNISKENCSGMGGYYYSASDNLCKPQETCPGGKELVNADGTNPGSCRNCTGAQYKSGENRSPCLPRATCPNGQELHGDSNTSAGSCRWCPAETYKDSGQNRSRCAPQGTCPNGQELVGNSNQSAGSCRWCPGGTYKNSGQNRSRCAQQTQCPNGQELHGASNTSAGSCRWCSAGTYKSGYNRNSCSRCPNAQYQRYSGRSYCDSPTYNHASWMGYYNGDWYEFDYLPSSETGGDWSQELSDRLIYHLKRRFFAKHPTGIARHGRLPDVFMFRHTDRRAIAVWYDGINYDKHYHYYSWQKA